MSVNRDETIRISKLAKLNLSDDEINNLTKDLNEVLDYVNQLNELDTYNVEPLINVNEGYSAELREDQLKDGVTREKSLKNAPQKNENYFKVPKVIG